MAGNKMGHLNDKQKNALPCYKLVCPDGTIYEGNYRQMMHTLVNLEYRDYDNPYIQDNKAFYDEESSEIRMNVIGQNGNSGLHYDEVNNRPETKTEK